MALGDKVARLSSEAGRGLGQIARAGKDGIGEAATKLRPAQREEAAAPPAGLEQLLAREEVAVRNIQGPAPDLTQVEHWNGRATRVERECQDVWISVGAVSIKKKN